MAEIAEIAEMAARAEIAETTARRDPEKPRLFYAGACPLCRFLSRTVVLLSLGAIEREPLDRAEAAPFYYERYPEAQGKPVLFHRGRPIFGGRVFLAIPAAIAHVGWNQLGFGRTTDRLVAGGVR